MIIFRKALILTALLVSMRFLSISNACLYTSVAFNGALRIPSSFSKGSKGPTISRRDFAIRLASAAAGIAAANALNDPIVSMAIGEPVKPVKPIEKDAILNQNNNQSQIIENILREIGNYSDASKIAMAIEKLFTMEEWNKMKVEIDEIKDLKATNGKEYIRKLKELFSFMYRKCFSLESKEATNISKSLIAKLPGTEIDIFEEIGGVEGLPKDEKDGIEKDMIACSAKAQLAYVILKSIGADDVSVDTSHNHAFIRISAGQGYNYLLANFSIGAFISDTDIKPTGCFVEVENSENYITLEQGLKITPSELLKLRKDLEYFSNNKQISLFISRVSPKQLINLIHPYIHVVPPQYSHKGATFIVHMQRGLAYFRVGFFYRNKLLAEINSKKDEQDIQRYRKAAVDYFNKAIREYEIAKSLNPAFDASYGNIANAYACLFSILIDQKTAEMAVKNYEVAVELNPLNPVTYDGLGNFYSLSALAHPDRSEENLRKAVENFQKALDLDAYSRDSAVTFSNLGNAYSSLGFIEKDSQKKREMYNKAEEVYKQAMDMEPENPWFLFNAGAVQYILGELETTEDKRKEYYYTESVRNLEKANKFNRAPSWEIYLGLARSYYKIGQTAKAASFFKKAVDINPDVLSMVPEELRKKLISFMQKSKDINSVIGNGFIGTFVSRTCL